MDLQLFGDAALTAPSRDALRELPWRQFGWVAASAATGALLGATQLWAWGPELSLLFALSAGATAAHPRRMWAAPAVAGLVCLTGVAAGAAGVPPIVGGGLAAGAIAAALSPHRVDLLDIVNGSLGGVIGASLGLWAAVQLLPTALPDLALAPLTSALVGLLASQSLLPVALRFQPGPTLPTRNAIHSALKARYRPPAIRALTLYEKIVPNVPDSETRRGLAEVTSWVFHLLQAAQALDGDLETIDVDDTRAKIAACEQASDEDPFTSERRRATAGHLRRLLEHRDAIALERDRTEALVDYALAFLAEARAGRTLARHLPGEHEPEQLDEVLERLRSDAREGDLRRRAAREVDGRSQRGYEGSAERQ